jgi:TP901 family phage tail tape measure protein
MAGAVSTLTIKLQDDVSAPAAKVAAALKKAEAEAKAISNAIKDSGISNRLGQALAKIGMSAGDITKVGTAWKDYARAAGQGADATKWTSANKAQMKLWENATIGSLRAVQREQAKMVEMNKQVQKVVSSHPPASKEVIANHKGKHGDTIAAVGVAIAAHKGKEEIKKGVKTYAKADDTLRYQGAMADLTDKERASRYNQGIKLGPQYGLQPTDIYKAQEKLAGRGVKKEFIEPFTAQLVGYAKAMNTPIEEAAKTLETIIFTTNQNVHDAATASDVMRKQIDIAVKAAKLGGLSNEDIQAGAKFGAGTAHGAGFKNETIFGLMAAFGRIGMHGDEAGVATRAMASRLVAPTRKGREAMQVNGIDYSSYTKHPDEMGADGIESLMQSRFGKKISGDQRNRLEAVLDDSDIVNKPDEFVSQVTQILQDSFDKGKSGKSKAQDSQKVAKLASDFLQKSTSNVDVEGLLSAILNKNLGISALNDLFTDKHGGKAKALSEKSDVFSEITEALRHVKDGFADGIAQKRMEGVDGSLKRLDASTEAFTLQVASANDSLIKFSADLASSALAKASQADPATLQTGTAVAGGITAAAVISAGSAYFSGAGLTAAIAAGAGTAAGIVGSPIFLGAAALAGAYLAANREITPEERERRYNYLNPEKSQTLTGNTLKQPSSLSVEQALKKANARKLQVMQEIANGEKLIARRDMEMNPDKVSTKAQLIDAGIDTEKTNASFDSLKAKAEETGVAVKTALTVTPTITINTDALSAASAQVDALLAKLAQISSAASRIGPMINNLQQRMNSSFSE